MAALVFVYGTLKRGFPNHARFLGRARRIGHFQTAAPFPLVLNGERRSPCLIDQPGIGQAVRGEVYEVDESVLAALDRLERTTAASGYHRRTIEVISRDDKEPAKLMVDAYFKSPHLVTAPQSPNLSAYTPAMAAGYLPRP